MKVVWSWLKEYVDLDGVSVDEVAERLTLAGLEVDGIERIGDWWDPERIVIGAVTKVEPHPEADRLVLAWVDYGANAPHRCVTGAPNLFEYKGKGDIEPPLHVVFAREGAELFDGHDAGWKKITLKGRPVRGIMSDAMVCSEKEIGLSEEHEGIMLLDADTPIGAPITEVLGDAVIDLDLTANYAYAANIVGLAREVAALLDRPFTEPSADLVATSGVAPDERTKVELDATDNVTDDVLRGADRDPDAERDAGDHTVPGVSEIVDIVIEDPDLCARYIARVIKSVSTGQSPWWMRRRLTLSGMRPINNLIDITNYAMLEWGEPLHAFDLDRLVERAGGAKPVIAVRRARDGERMTTLDGVDRTLDHEMILICDAAGPIAIAGVMGGEDTEVTDETKNILLEAATFDYTSVRRTSGILKLPSESSWRFGRNVPPSLGEIGSRRAAGLYASLAGGTIVPGAVDAYPRPAEPVEIEMPLSDFERILGLKLPTDEITAILGRLGFQCRIEGERLRAVVPEHRVDQTIPADLVEEVIRVYGYDRLPSTQMADPLPAQVDNPQLMLEESARDALVDAGLQEIISYRLVSVKHEAELAADPVGLLDPDDYAVLANPVSPERSSLRRSILTGLLDAARDNLRFRNRVALFELGGVYHAADGEPGELPDEPTRIGLLMSGSVKDAGWHGGDDRDLEFFDAKGAVETLLDKLGVTGTEFNAYAESSAHPSLHPARAAEIRAADGTLLGHVGELHPIVAERWDLGERPVVVADLDLDAIGGVGGSVRLFTAFSSYPASYNDLAIVVDETVPAASVEAVIRTAAGPLLVECTLFDVYRGEQLGQNEKSLAYSLAFQAPDKTLSSKAVEGMRGRIVKALESELGAELR